MKNIFLFSLLMLMFSSCQPEIKPIDYGTAECDYCRMTIVDDQYAAELVNANSKAFVFDATECMLRYMKDDASIDYSLVLVTDYLQPRKLIDAKNAYFIRSKNLPSPLGMYITSVGSQLEAEELQKKHGGEIFNYNTLKEEFPSMEPL